MRSVLIHKKSIQNNPYKKRAIDKQLVRTIVMQYLPMSIVGGAEFIKYSNLLDSRYTYSTK